MTLQERALLEFIDLTAQILCSQIHNDYNLFLKNYIKPQLTDQADLKVREINILACMAHISEPVQAHEIARIKRLDPATMTRGLTRLEDRKLIARDRSQKDRRSNVISLTPEGAELTTQYLSSWTQAINNADHPHIWKNKPESSEFLISTLGRLKNRATAFALFNPDRPPPTQADLEDVRSALRPTAQTIFKSADYFFQSYTNTISTEYFKFIKSHIIKKLNGIEGMDLRALRVLMCVDFFNNPITPIDVANTMRIDPATVTRGLSTLEAIGKIERSANRLDHRSRYILMTTSGKEFANSYRDRTKEAIAEAETFLLPSLPDLALTQQDRENIVTALFNLSARSTALSGLTM